MLRTELKLIGLQQIMRPYS